ncbi:hypothetical protein [Paenibacillus aquistagni]|uniref:hypothetical protein n=1 Tax=Paenibacillus aquistagni TaxID=1852522 RepID=UPI00145B6FC8|nr:hypothetical protein [Paenibacillus aquistagni]NMM52129.1 hypothetical protein [Paenibacillus aquistagni]
MNKDLFKVINSHNSLILKATSPLIQSQKRILDLSSPWYETINRIQQITSPAKEFQISVQDLFAPINQALKQADEIAKSFDISGSLNNLYRDWEKTFDKIKKLDLTDQEIPSEIQPRLNELTSALWESIPIDNFMDHTDEETPITESEKIYPSNEIVNWNKLFAILSFLIPLALSVHLSNQSSEQLERIHNEQKIQNNQQHQEMLEEERKQTELLREQNELINEQSRLMGLLLKNINEGLDSQSDSSIDLQLPESD